MSILKKIVLWNKERGLLDKEFNHQKEVSFIIEELLESTGNENSLTARDQADEISKNIMQNSNATNEDIIDAFADIIIYATGVISKMGYNPDIVMDEVLKEINSRTGTLVDGKFIKDINVITYKADFNKARK